MKKSFIIILGAIAGVVLAMPLRAADLPGGKFGYVDFQRALNEVDEGKRAKSALKGEFEQKQRQLDGIQKELQQMQTDLEKQRLILSADALKEKEDVYRKKVIDLTEKMNAYKMELQVKEARMTGGILGAIKGIVRDIGQKEGYTMILEKSQDVVLFSPSNADLTERVIREYNSMPKAKREAASQATTGPSDTSTGQ